jgi:hypothetical protein
MPHERADKQRATSGTRELCDPIKDDHPPGHVPANPEGESHHGIEVRGYVAQEVDRRHQIDAGREGCDSHQLIGGNMGPGESSQNAGDSREDHHEASDTEELGE